MGQLQGENVVHDVRQCKLKWEQNVNRITDSVLRKTNHTCIISDDIEM